MLPFTGGKLTTKGSLQIMCAGGIYDRERGCCKQCASEANVSNMTTMPPVVVNSIQLDKIYSHSEEKGLVDKVSMVISSISSSK